MNDRRCRESDDPQMVTVDVIDDMTVDCIHDRAASTPLHSYPLP
jgi:hypothetical protein